MRDDIIAHLYSSSMKKELTLSDKVNQLKESATLAMSKLSRELTANGERIINLGLGEPDFNTPDFIKKAAESALAENYTHYTPVAGFNELRKAIAEKLKRENELDYDYTQIVVSTGAKQALMNAIFSVVNPGDEVLLPAPFWGSYAEMVELAGGIPVLIAADITTDFKINKDQLAEGISDKTKLFLFSSPNNPTGTVYSKEELASLSTVFERYPHIYILSDEIYEHINYVAKHESIAQFPAVKDRVILINGFSKAYAMTGWRLGYLAASKEVAYAAEKIQSQITSGTCSIAQRAGIAAYSTPTDSVMVMNKAFKKRRDLAYRLLAEIPGLKTNLPDGAFYFFPDVTYYFGKRTPDGNEIKNAGDLSLYLLYSGHVATVAGDSFGNGNHIRLSYAASENDLEMGLAQIKIALANLK